MDLNLRKAVIANVHTNSQEELQDVIVDAIQRGEEKLLPGLGVFFEVIWNHSDQDDKQEMLSTLETGLKNP